MRHNFTQSLGMRSSEALFFFFLFFFRAGGVISGLFLAAVPSPVVDSISVTSRKNRRPLGKRRHISMPR